jgi:chromosome condensin MukBEF MukE localization factor
MEINTYEEIDPLKFFEHENAERDFGTVDYALRNSKYLQRQHPEQINLFDFVYDNEKSLRKYYQRFFGAELRCRGASYNQYYFLHPLPDVHRKIPSSNQEFLKTEHLIIGLLICKIYFIDMQEVYSVSTLIHLIRTEYETYREGLFRQLARVQGGKESEFDDKKLEECLRDAVKKFKSLGWLYERPDTKELQVMPSFDRIRDMYQDEIINIQSKYQQKK